MPEDKRDRRANAKEQRKPRNSRHQTQTERKVEKKSEEPKSVPKAPTKPEHESPGPEFFKNLKRETDEILKITEEENTKYKKKEIQSNWGKYEMPIESYDEIEEQENMGADYEKLIQAPLSVGGHFQFKHEKSWDLNTAPSLYDKYFEINMDKLSLALSTIPFYERNTIDKKVFTETDILSMNNRATRFKQKYYNDKSYTTPEVEASDKILNSLREKNQDNLNVTNAKVDDNLNIQTNITDNISNMEHIVTKNLHEEYKKERTDLDNEVKEKMEALNVPKTEVDENSLNIKTDDKLVENDQRFESAIDNKLNDVQCKKEDFEGAKPKIPSETINIEAQKSLTFESQVPDNSDNFDDFVFGKEQIMISKEKVKSSLVDPVAVPKVPQAPPEPKKNPIIESPEDLEKWLDDFLDG